jgi:hypothetical protein
MADGWYEAGILSPETSGEPQVVPLGSFCLWLPSKVYHGRMPIQETICSDMITTINQMSDHENFVMGYSNVQRGAERLISVECASHACAMR